ncbi:hypothetical protein ACM66B_005493 [Microbotryomycetes sp. NB124-2]
MNPFQHGSTSAFGASGSVGSSSFQPFGQAKGPSFVGHTARKSDKQAPDEATANDDPLAAPSRPISSLEVLGDDSEARKQRFESSLANNRYLELKPLREAQRQKYIKAGVIPDPTKPMRLDEATNFVGKCTEMCPEWEREEREYQNNVDPLERYPGTTRIDPARAVKAFHRPAAGNEQPLPEDVRPPPVLKTTLDYLFHQVLPKHPMHVTHPFLRDRTRAVRQDLTMQNVRDGSAIECNERIARYHVLSIGTMREQAGFSESQELEQLRKVLKSLNEFYDDARLTDPPIPTPNEAEFRAYNILTHLRDPDIIWSCESLPDAVFEDPLFQLALQLHRLAQRANMSRGERASLNAYARFFKLVASAQVPFLFGCILSTHFAEIRTNALESMRSAYLQQHTMLTAKTVARVLGCDSEAEAVSICADLNIATSASDDGRTLVEIHRASPMTRGTIKAHNSIRLVESKRGSNSYADVIDGKGWPSSMTGQIPAPYVSPAVPIASTSTTRAKQAKTLSASASPFSPAATISSTPATQIPARPPLSSGHSSQPAQPVAKLNAAAPAFVAPAPPSKAQPAQAPTPLFRPSSVDQTISRPLPATSAPVIAPAQTAVSRTTNPAATVRQKRPSLKPVSELAPVRSQPTVVDLKPIIRKLTRGLTDELVKRAVQQTTKRAAELALKERWDFVITEKERVQRDIVRRVADGFVRQTVQQTVAEEALKARRRRTTMEKVLDSWKRLANDAQERRLAEEARLRHFNAVARDVGPNVIEQDGDDEIAEYESEDEDDGALRLTSLADTLAAEVHGRGDDEDALLSSRVENATRQRNKMWQSGRWANALRRHLGRQIPNPISRWDVLVVVENAQSPVSKWLACKLNLEDNVAVLRSGTRQSRVRLTDRQSADLVLSHVGLVVFEMPADSESDVASQRLAELANAVNEHSVYACDLLVIKILSSKSQDADARDFVVAESALFSKISTVTLTLDSADEVFEMHVATLPQPVVRSDRWRRPLALLLAPLIKFSLSMAATVSSTASGKLNLLVLQRFCDVLKSIERAGNTRADGRLSVIPDCSNRVRDAVHALMAEHGPASVVLSLELAQWPPATDRRLVIVALESMASELLQAAASVTVPQSTIDSDSDDLMRRVSEDVSMALHSLSRDNETNEREPSGGKKRKASASQFEELSPKKLAQRPAMGQVEANAVDSAAAVQHHTKSSADSLAALTSLMHETSRLLSGRT